MKKYLSLFLVGLVALMPIITKADSINVEQGSREGDIISATVTYNIDSSRESLTVTLTEKGGAEIQSVKSADDSDWTVESQNREGNVITVVVTSPGVSGEGDLFTFTYKASGTADCKVSVSLGDQTVETETPTPDDKEDEPTENKKTGATLPYIALGAIAVLATGTYLVTRNKSKMYKL